MQLHFYSEKILGKDAFACHENHLTVWVMYGVFISHHSWGECYRLDRFFYEQCCLY